MTCDAQITDWGNSTSNHPEKRKFVTHTSQIFPILCVPVGTIKTRKSWRFEPSTPFGSKNIAILVFRVYRGESRIRDIMKSTFSLIISLLHYVQVWKLLLARFFARGIQKSLLEPMEINPFRDMTHSSQNFGYRYDTAKKIMWHYLDWRFFVGRCSR